MSVEVHVREYGQGRAMVLLHGWGANGQVWRSLPDEFTLRRRLIVVDLPGHGHSPAPPAESFDLVSALAMLVDEPADWVGWSLGGLLAQQVAAQAPAKVRRLVCVAAGPRFTASDDWPWAVAPGLLEDFAQAVRQDAARALNRFAALQARGDARSASLLRRWRDWQRTQPAPQLTGLLWGLTQLRELDGRAVLPGLACPGLFVFGQHDALVPAAVARQLTALNPAFAVRIIAGAAHLPHWSDPAAFNQLVTEFCIDG